jgi:hypothetical protein
MRVVDDHPVRALDYGSGETHRIREDRRRESSRARGDAPRVLSAPNMFRLMGLDREARWGLVWIGFWFVVLVVGSINLLPNGDNVSALFLLGIFVFVAPSVVGETESTDRPSRRRAGSEAVDLHRSRGPPAAVSCRRRPPGACLAPDTVAFAARSDPDSPQLRLFAVVAQSG